MKMTICDGSPITLIVALVTSSEGVIVQLMARA